MTNLKRILAALLVVMMVIAIFPATVAGATTIPSPWDEERTLVKDFGEVTEKYEYQKPETKPAEVVPKKAYSAVDALFEELDAMNETAATKGLSAEKFTEKVVAKVTTSPTYKADSVEVNGEVVTWWTTDGIHCMYNPRMDKIADQFTGTDTIDEIVNEPGNLVKGGKPTGKEVYLIGPYYGIDSNFTDQYKKEASRIAKAIGDPDGYTLYSGRAATIDKVAEAVSNGAVVIYDSHGSTDYSNGDDFVTGANYSYLCLNSEDGITYDDYYDGCLYGGGQAFVNGDVIANHMTKNSPAGISWFAICLSMATNTLANPLRNKGVEVVYGYSQSVTFAGDYLFEETFWDNMLAGKTVAQSISAMKSEWGNWDWSTQIAAYYGDYYSGYSTISSARSDYSAFPIVVSDEDSHPGQRSGSSWGACSLQTVKSTYTLGNLPGNGNGDISNPPVITGDNYHQKVINYLRTNGNYDSTQGLYWIGQEYESDNYKWYYYISDLNGQIWLESHIISKYYGLYDDHVNVYLTEGSENFDIEASVEYYPNENAYDTYPINGYDARANFTKNTTYRINGNNGTYITVANAQSEFNFAIQDMFSENDSILYNAVGFGVKCLGFINYDGYGPDPVTTTPGDVNNDGTVTNDDVIALMWNVLFPADNPITGDGDFNNDGAVTNDDVTLLMWHVLFPDENPLS